MRKGGRDTEKARRRRRGGRGREGGGGRGRGGRRERRRRRRRRGSYTGRGRSWGFLLLRPLGRGLGGRPTLRSIESCELCEGGESMRSREEWRRRRTSICFAGRETDGASRAGGWMGRPSAVSEPLEHPLQHSMGAIQLGPGFHQIV